jgi:hypothetical protein
MHPYARDGQQPSGPGGRGRRVRKGKQETHGIAATVGPICPGRKVSNFLLSLSLPYPFWKLIFLSNFLLYLDLYRTRYTAVLCLDGFLRFGLDKEMACVGA